MEIHPAAPDCGDRYIPDGAFRLFPGTGGLRILLLIMDLFNGTPDGSHQPLAYRMRPRTLDEFIGQEAIIGKGRLLRRIIQADRISSVIFHGPPGTGKTTLARVIAGTTRSRFITMNAVLSGVKELREAISEAKAEKSLYERRTILFIDEVHRWNKAQQDALLPWVENGTIIMIGATTQNPYFEVNPALVSRSRIFRLQPLTKRNLETIARNALNDRERGYGRYRVEFEEGALEHIVDIANGDARSLLNALELAVETTGDQFPPEDSQPIKISLEAAEESIQRKVVLYDKEGDYHFDTVSAFIKSLRGSDPDAALYWLARMVAAGEDPRFIFRRMLILASEDVGLADPYALGVVEAAAAAFDRVGLPEGRFHLTHAALYLSNTQKSNSCMGFFDALKQIENEQDGEVPRHLKDPNRDAEDLGHGEDYLYPHGYRDHWVAQKYLPRGVEGTIFYTPGSLGWEADKKEELARRREVIAEAWDRRDEQEVLSHSPADRSFDRFYRRYIENRETEIARVRDRLFDAASPGRTDRILVLTAGKSSLLWEALRRAPDGGVWAAIQSLTEAERIEEFTSDISIDRRPVAVHLIKELPEGIERGITFECIIGRDLFTRAKKPEEFLTTLFSLASPGCRIALAQILPGEGTRLSDLAEEDGRLPAEFKKAEDWLYNKSGLLVTRSLMENSMASSGFTDLRYEDIEWEGERFISQDTFASWFDSGRDTSYAGLLKKKLTEEQLTETRMILEKIFLNRPVAWRTRILIIYGRRDSQV